MPYARVPYAKTRKPTEIPNAVLTGERFKLIIWDEQRARLCRLARKRPLYEHRKNPFNKNQAIDNQT